MEDCSAAQDGARQALKEKLNYITDRVMGAAIEVHKALGLGLLESTYEACLAFELGERQLRVERQKPLPVRYRSVLLDCGYRLDLIVEGTVIIEVKSIDKLLPIHKAQLLTYLKLTGCKVGLLINFNVPKLVEGVVRPVNGFPE